MSSNVSIRFFDEQYRRQLQAEEPMLNPFELSVLPYLEGRVLDFGCGLGQLAVAAARRGCRVHALDASPTAIAHLDELARGQALAIEAEQADLRDYALVECYDTVASIGLLMFFDCETAGRQLRSLQTHLRPGGVAAINLLVEGTTYLDMFDPRGFCLLAREDLLRAFQGWEILHLADQDFAAPNGQTKAFTTLVARKPAR